MENVCKMLWGKKIRRKLKGKLGEAEINLENEWLKSTESTSAFHFTFIKMSCLKLFENIENK